MNAKRLGIVIPCFNEEEVVPETAKRTTALVGRLCSLDKISADSKIVFIDDGSRDRTWAGS
jgi:glycosyltransferase involved in cell wall biosynthesis